MPETTHIDVRSLTLAYGGFTVLRDLTFGVGRGRVFVIMGGSGCGKSTLLRAMTGLLAPASGEIRYAGADLVGADAAERGRIVRTFGVLYQAGALWSSMTVAENVALPLREYTALPGAEIADLVEFKLSLVGLSGAGGRMPSELSGGMRKRAGLARAMALDPEVLFLDEPSAGLDPVSARQLDDLILELRDGLGATVVVVTHELASIFAIADDAIFLDARVRTMTAAGPPRELLAATGDPALKAFLTRGAEPRETEQTT